MTLGLLLGAGLFIVVAIAGTKNALFIPGLVLLAAAAANMLL